MKHARSLPSDARVGTTLLGKWTLDAVIGRGGMATVYAATHRNGSRVAIKILDPTSAGDPDVVQRFMKEGYIGNAVAHPGAVRAFDDGTTEDGTPFLVMELLEGETLHDKLRNLRSTSGCFLSPAMAVRIVNAVLDVLSSAHAHGLVHRDIKPENIFVQHDGAVKLLDFGIARDERQNFETRNGATFGTPVFMAPEQARGEWNAVDGRTDLWAIGATLFFALTGRMLRRAGTPAEELVAAMSPTPPVHSMVSGIPSAFAQVLDRALAYDPADRFPNAEAMKRALEAALETSAPKERTELVSAPPMRSDAFSIPGLQNPLWGRLRSLSPSVRAKAWFLVPVMAVVLGALGAFAFRSPTTSTVRLPDVPQASASPAVVLAPEPPSSMTDKSNAAQPQPPAGTTPAATRGAPLRRDKAPEPAASAKSGRDPLGGRF